MGQYVTGHGRMVRSGSGIGMGVCGVGWWWVGYVIGGWRYMQWEWYAISLNYILTILSVFNLVF